MKLKWLVVLWVVLLSEVALGAFSSYSTHNLGSGLCPQGNALADGCPAANATGVQSSSLLNGYGVRPAWNVAGIDYPVGLPTSVSLSDPLPSGSLASFFGPSGLKCTLGGASITISCTDVACNNATISGWDFSLHNGIRLETTCNNIHITQNNFKVGSNTVPNLHIQAGTSGCTIDYNTFDGDSIPTSDGATGLIGGLLTINNTGTCTLQYNLIQNAYFQTIQKGGDSSATTQVVKFNWIKDAGTGHVPAATFTGVISGGVLTASSVVGTIGLKTEVCDTGSCDTGRYMGYVQSFGTGSGGNGTYNLGHATASGSTSMATGGAHGDQVQDITSSGNVITSVVYSFGFYQQTGANSTQGLSVFSAGNQTGGEYDSATITNNVMLYGASSNSNSAIILDNTWLNGSSTIDSNYVDPTGLNSDWMFWGKLNTPDGPFTGTSASCHGNKNLTNNATFTATGGSAITCN